MCAIGVYAGTGHKESGVSPCLNRWHQAAGRLLRGPAREAVMNGKGPTVACAKAQLLEAKENLQHMLTSVPLTDDERAAVDDGQGALSQLLTRLADVPTPAGPTPNQIGIPPSVTLLPIADVRQGQNG